MPIRFGESKNFGLAMSQSDMRFSDIPFAPFFRFKPIVRVALHSRLDRATRFCLRIGFVEICNLTEVHFLLIPAISQGNIMLRFLFALAFALAMVGGGTMFCGYQTLERSAQVDADWESVTLEQWINGETKNNVLFEVSDFQPADEYYYLTQRRSNDYSMVYMPLYVKGQEQDSGENIHAIVGLGAVDNDKELWQILDKSTIKIQDYKNEVPSPAKGLSSSYPAIDWEKVRWASVNSEIPTAESAWQFIVIGGLFLFFAIVSISVGIALFCRNFFTRTKSYGSTVAKLESDGKSQGSAIGKSSTAPHMASLLNVVGYVFNFLIGFNLLVYLCRRFEVLDSDLAMQILYITVPLFFLIGAFVLLSSFFSSPKLHLEAKSKDELSPKVLETLGREIVKFQNLGFHLVGFSSSSFRENKDNAYLLSVDKKRLVEVSLKGRELTSIVMGVTNDGLVFEAGQCPIDLTIDGTKNGLPLVAKCWQKCTPQQALASFEEFNQLLASTGAHLLTIAPEQIFQLMHYEVILTGWWAYQNSVRFSKPESLPSLDELTSDGIEFSFCRDEELDNAFNNEEFELEVEQNSRKESSISTTTSGGEELVTAKFLQQV